MQERYNQYRVYQQRMKEMEVTRQQVAAELPILLAIAKTKYNILNDNVFNEYCFFLLTERFNRKPLRAYYLEKIAQYIDKKYNKQIIIKLGFAIEIVMVIQYLHNQILDSKAGVTTKEKINQNLIAGNILRELLFDYIHTEICKFGTHAAIKTAEYIARIFMYVDIGQMMEMNYGHYNSYQETTTAPLNTNSQINNFTNECFLCIRQELLDIKKGILGKEAFVDLYFRRLFLTNASLFVLLTQLVCDLLDSSGKKRNELFKFSIAYGAALQVVNDVADIESQDTIGKSRVDVFSDLKNSNITLPFIYHLQKSNKRLIERYLEDPVSEESIIKDFQEQLHQELINSQAINKSITASMILAERAKNFLNPNNAVSSLLWDIADIAEWNRYYKQIYEKPKIKPDEH